MCNCSWGFRQFFLNNSSYNLTFRGSSFTKTDVDSGPSAVPAVYYMSYGFGNYRKFTSVKTASQSEANEIANDPDCKNLIFVCAAGNSSDKQEEFNGLDYNNEITSASFYYSSGYDAYFNRPGTPAITNHGKDNAWIIVGSIDSQRQTGSQERCSDFSNRGPAIDVWAGGSYILSPYEGLFSYDDPRDSNFKLRMISGTSMACPNVSGVIATYLESNPDADQAAVRKWLYEEGSTTVSSSDYYDAYQSNGATDFNYWGQTYSLKSSPRRILFNPYANNRKATMSGF